MFDDVLLKEVLDSYTCADEELEFIIKWQTQLSRTCCILKMQRLGGVLHALKYKASKSIFLRIFTERFRFTIPQSNLSDIFVEGTAVQLLDSGVDFIEKTTVNKAIVHSNSFFDICGTVKSERSVNSPKNVGDQLAVRFIQRTVFQINENWSISLSEVKYFKTSPSQFQACWTETTKSKNSTYEIELEFTGQMDSLGDDELFAQVRELLRLLCLSMNGCTHVLSIEDGNNLRHSVETLLNKHSVGVELRSKMKPLTLDKSQWNSLQATGNVLHHFATVKADGEYCIVYVLQCKVYVITTTMIAIIGQTTSSLNDSVFEGEFLQQSGDKISSVIKLFDVLVHNRKSCISKMLKSRIELIELSVPLLSESQTQVEWRLPQYIELGPDYCSQLKHLFNNFEDYDIDGIILLPCGKYSDNAFRIWKWKPPSQQTIDFLVREKNSSFNLLVRDHNYEYVNFHPAGYFSKLVWVKNAILDEHYHQGIPVSDNTVLECKFDWKTKSWKIQRFRWDKKAKKCNALLTALTIMHNSASPFDLWNATPPKNEYRQIISNCDVLIFLMEKCSNANSDLHFSTRRKTILLDANSSPPPLEDPLTNLLQHNMCHSKNKLDRISNFEWSKLRFGCDPFALLVFEKRLPKQMRHCAVGRPLNRGYYKLWEILVTHQAYMPFLKKYSKINFVGLAEAPGGFTQAFLHYITALKLNLDNVRCLISSIPTNNEILCFDQRLCNHRCVHMLYGDLLQVAFHDKLCLNQEEFGKCNLVTADGGFDVSVFGCGHSAEEYLHNKLILAELICALRLMKVGGAFVLKIKSFCGRFIEQLIFIMTRLWRRVVLHKPFTSRSWNSENYLVCTNFRDYNTVIQSVIRQLSYVLERSCKKNNYFLFDSDILDICRIGKSYKNFQEQLNFIRFSKISNYCILMRQTLGNSKKFTKKSQKNSALEWLNYFITKSV